MNPKRKHRQLSYFEFIVFDLPAKSSRIPRAAYWAHFERQRNVDMRDSQSVCFLAAFLSAACIFMLWTRHLVMVYMFLTSLGLTFLSYWSNVSALALTERSPSMVEDLMSLNTTRLLDSGGVVMSLAPHLLAQWFMGMLFAYIHLGPRFEHVQRSMPIIFASPILLAMLPLPAKVVQHLPVVAVFTPIILTKITLMQSAMEASRTVYNGYQYAMNFVSNFGLSALIENEWQRLNVPNVLRVFWTIRWVSFPKRFINLC